MATKLYLHAVTSSVTGTLPTDEQSTLTPDANDFEGSRTTNRTMNTTVGVSQANLTNTSTADTSAHNYYISRWVSPLIYQGSIDAKTWTLEYGAKEANAAANFPVSGTAVAGRVNCYIWKPSDGTKVGTILDGNTNVDCEEAGTTQSVINCTFTGAAVTGLTPGDAVLVIELWAIVTQANGTARVQDVYYDGTTENSTTNEAAYLSTPENLQFTETESNATLIVSSGDRASTVNTTEYWSLAGRTNDSHTTEADVQIPIRVPGTLSKLTVKLKANTVTGTSTFTVMKNGSATSLVASATTTGEQVIEDLTNTVSLVAGDKISLKSVPGAATNTYTIASVSTMFVPTDYNTTCQIFAQHTNLNLASASSTADYSTNGSLTSSIGVEAKTKIRQRVAGTYQYFFVYVTANARTTSTTFKTRKNGTDGNISITVGAGQTGLFENTGSTDTVASGDDYNFRSVTGTGTETLTMSGIGIHFTNNLANGTMVTAASATINAATTNFFPIGGGFSQNVTESFGKRKVRMSKVILRDLHIYVSTNTVTADSIATVMVNGVATAITTTITNATTGLFVDTTHTATVGSNDDIDLKIVAGATGTSYVINSIVLYYTTGRIYKSSILKYHVLGRISLSRIYKSHLLGRLSLSRVYKSHILARVSRSRTYLYNLLGRISLSRILKYNLLGRVSLSRIYKFHEQARISLSRIYKNHVASRVSLSRIYRSHILSRVSLSRTYLYHLLSRVSLSRTYLSHLLSRISLSRIYKYNNLGRVSLPYTIKYHVLKRISLSATYLWNIIEEALTRISKDQTYKYHILGRVSLSRIYKAHILGRVSLSRVYLHQLLGRISLTRSYLYNALGRVQLSRIYKYHILQRVSLSRTYLYNLLHRVSLTRTYLYGLLSRISLSRTYLYNLQMRVSLARTYVYDVIAASLARISKSQVYKYHLQSRVTLSRLYKSNILSRISIQTIYKYNILLKVSKASTLLYNVIGRVSKALIAKYIVQSRITKASILLYNVAVRISLSRIYKHSVLGHISISQIYKHSILGRISLQRIYKYIIDIRRSGKTETGKFKGQAESKAPKRTYRNPFYIPKILRRPRRSRHTTG